MQLLTPTTARECLHTIEIAPLTLTQTKAYLIWACEQADGQAGASPFTEEDIDTIFKSSQGIIAKINTAARQLLAMKSSTNSGWKHLLRGKLLWWGGIIVIIILLLYVYKYISQPAEVAKTFTKPIALRQQPKSDDKLTNKQHKIGNMLVNTQTKNKQAIATQPPVQQKTALAPNNFKTEPKVNKSTSVQSSATKVATKKQIAPQYKKNDTRANALFDRVMQGKLAMQRKRVLTINPRNYTLQLLATADLHAAQHFILQHNIQTTAMLVQTEQKGKQWYVVIYGIFPDKKQALQATKSLTPKLKPSQFWFALTKVYTK